MNFNFFRHIILFQLIFSCVLFFSHDFIKKKKKKKRWGEISTMKKGNC